MPMPVPSDASSMPPTRTRMRSLRATLNAVQSQVLVSEAMTRKLLDEATEALSRSYELLEQVRQGRESADREAACILERLQKDAVGRSPRDGMSGRRGTPGITPLLPQQAVRRG